RVELSARRDLAQRRGLWVVVAEDGTLNLTAGDRLLDKHLAVVSRSFAERFGEVLARADLAHADGGAAVGGLDEARVPEDALRLADGLGRLALEIPVA